MDGREGGKERERAGEGKRKGRKGRGGNGREEKYK